MSKSYSSDRRVAQRYGVDRATIWRWANEPRFAHLGFPKPDKFGPNTTRWDDDRLDQYDAERHALSEPADASA